MLYVYQMNALTAAEQESLMQAADRCNESICMIEEGDLQRTVAEVMASLQPLNKADFVPVDYQKGAPFLLMDIEKDALDAVLAAMREYHVRIGHKCMVTESNRVWTIEKLIGDVIEEHALMTALMKLQKLVESVASIDEKSMPPEMWALITERKQLAESLFAQIGEVEIPVEQAEAVLTKFEEAVAVLKEGGLA